MDDGLSVGDWVKVGLKNGVAGDAVGRDDAGARVIVGCDGETLGVIVGERVGRGVGNIVSTFEGGPVKVLTGEAVDADGDRVGFKVGVSIGCCVGDGDGRCVGVVVGAPEGVPVGGGVGNVVGLVVGDFVGVFVGAIVDGALVGLYVNGWFDDENARFI